MSEMAPQPLVQEGGVPQHPASDRGMIDTQTTFCHHLFQIAIAEGISKVPPHTQHDDLFLEVSSSEQSWPVRSHSAYLTNAAPLFATLPTNTLSDRKQAILRQLCAVLHGGRPHSPFTPGVTRQWRNFRTVPASSHPQMARHLSSLNTQQPTWISGVYIAYKTLP